MIPNPQPPTPNPTLDDDLSKLSSEDLRRVCLFIEDRFVNAVAPLDMELQRQMPGVMAADVVYQRARRAVDRVLQIVGEVRGLTAASRQQAAASSPERPTARRGSRQGTENNLGKNCLQI